MSQMRRSAESRRAGTLVAPDAKGVRLAENTQTMPFSGAAPMSRKPVPVIVTVAGSPRPPPAGCKESGATSARSYSSNCNAVPEAVGSAGSSPFWSTSTS